MHERAAAYKARDRDSEAFQKARGRIAYVYLVGGYPTHLRAASDEIIRHATDLVRGPHPYRDGVVQHLRVRDEIVALFDLRAHPMVHLTLRKIAEGFRVVLPPKLTERRPFSRVLLARMTDGSPERITVQIDGSIKEGWARSGGTASR